MPGNGARAWGVGRAAGATVAVSACGGGALAGATSAATGAGLDAGTVSILPESHNEALTTQTKLAVAKAAACGCHRLDRAGGAATVASPSNRRIAASIAARRCAGRGGGAGGTTSAEVRSSLTQALRQGRRAIPRRNG